MVKESAYGIYCTWELTAFWIIVHRFHLHFEVIYIEYFGMWVPSHSKLVCEASQLRAFEVLYGYYMVISFRHLPRIPSFRP